MNAFYVLNFRIDVIENLPIIQKNSIPALRESGGKEANFIEIFTFYNISNKFTKVFKYRNLQLTQLSEANRAFKYHTKLSDRLNVEWY